MFEYLIEIEPRLYDRFLTVERNVKAASNSFYDAYLDLQEQFIKTVAVSCGFDIKARETCGELLRRTDVQNYFKEILHIDDFTYNKGIQKAIESKKIKDKKWLKDLKR